VWLITRTIRELIPNTWDEVVVKYYVSEYTKEDGNKGFKDVIDIKEATIYKTSPKRMIYANSLHYGGYKVEEIQENIIVHEETRQLLEKLGYEYEEDKKAWVLYEDVDCFNSNCIEVTLDTKGIKNIKKLDGRFKWCKEEINKLKGE